MAPYVGQLTKMMKTYLPLALAIGSVAMGIPGPQIKIMAEALKLLPDVEAEAHDILKRTAKEDHDDGVSIIRGNLLRALREFLHDKDKPHHWGELEMYMSPEGHYYWLCPEHYEEMARPRLGKP